MAIVIVSFDLRAMNRLLRRCAPRNDGAIAQAV